MFLISREEAGAILRDYGITAGIRALTELQRYHYEQDDPDSREVRLSYTIMSFPAKQAPVCSVKKHCIRGLSVAYPFFVVTVVISLSTAPARLQRT